MSHFIVPDNLHGYFLSDVVRLCCLEHVTDTKCIELVNAASIVSEIGSIRQFNSALRLKTYGENDWTWLDQVVRVIQGGYRESRINISAMHRMTPYESSVSLVTYENMEFYNLFTRELEKKKSRAEAYVVVTKGLLFPVYSIIKNGKSYRERKPRKRGEIHFK